MYVATEQIDYGGDVDWKSMSLTNWAVHDVKQMIRDKRRTVEDSSTIQDLCP